MERRSIAGDTRGATHVEYVTVVVLVTLTGALAIAALGPSLLATFRFAELLVAAPVP
jgi:hypothetical protein